MNRKLINVYSAIAIVVLQACAGSAPDYTPRNPLRAQEAKLAQFFDKEEAPERTQTVIAPLCGSDAGGPKSGWGIDGGNWCIVACGIAGVGDAGWMTDASGNRCLVAAGRAPPSAVTAQFSWADLSLNQPALFKGFSRSFLSDTEWNCKEFRYRIDPQSKVAFWDELDDSSVLYRFHRDSKLVIGKDLKSAKPSGSWSVRENNRIFFNQREVFKHAIDYGGGRFDDFISTKEKQVCRFVREADPVIGKI